MAPSSRAANVGECHGASSFQRQTVQLPTRVTGALAEWRWPLLVSLLLLVVLEVPFRLAASQTTTGLHFGGMLSGINDPPQYYSAMRQGAASARWLIFDQFSAEPHSPALLYPFYVALGKLGRLLGLGIEELFLHASTFGRAFLLAAIYFATGIVSTDRSTRRLAFVLVATSSGIGTALALVMVATGLPLSVSLRDREYPELNTFVTFLTAPHLMVGLSLLLVAARLYADCWNQRRSWQLLSLAFVVIAVGLTNPFSLMPFVAAVVLHGLVMTCLLRRWDVGGSTAAVVAVAAAVPSLAGNAVTFTFDPFWSLTYGRQNVQLTPPMLDIAEAFGLLLPLAALGLPTLFRAPTPGRVLALVWVLSAMILMQLPFGTQRRFGTGLHAMLVLLAAPGAVLVMRALHNWLRRGRRRFARPLVASVLIQALFGSTVYSYFVVLSFALAPSVGFLAQQVAVPERSPYHPEAVTEVAAWLRMHASSDDLILGVDLTGNYLAGATPSRVYVGHWVATLDYGTKGQQANWFYSEPLDDARIGFLQAAGIDYVVFGPHERRLGGSVREGSTLRRVYSGSGVDLFEVVPTGAPVAARPE